jgi:hypothetical protein
MVDAERSLWRAVLAQAFDDAEIAPNCSDIEFEPWESARARQYLRADSPQEAEHLHIVCGYAQIPADRLICWARQRYAVDEASEVKEVKEIEEVKDESTFDCEVSRVPLSPLPPLLP